MRARLKCERLIELIEASKLSQNHWAMRLGLSRGHFSDLVNGKYLYPSRRTQTRLTEVFGVPFDELFVIEGDRDEWTEESRAAFQAAIAHRYLVDEEVGRGGMGTVYLARDVKHGRRVAIKVISPEVVSGIGAALFLREIRRTASLDHHNILTLLDSGQAAGYPYYVMPYVKDGSLRARLDREGRLDVAETVQLVRGMAKGLHHAHRQNVVHCDIKPENILCSEDHPYVADFGIARTIHTETRKWGRSQEVDSSAGTPAYVSPEQASGEADLDGRADVYSLGCIVFEMLTGRLPFEGTTTMEMVAKRFVELPNLRSLAPHVPAVVAAVVARAMALEPNDRQASAAAFAEDLAQAATQRRVIVLERILWEGKRVRAVALRALRARFPTFARRGSRVSEDLRYTIRTLLRSPVFFSIAVVTLALGIGANTAIFSVVNGILLRSLPFPQAERLVALCETMPDEAGTCITASTPNVADWAELSRSFEGIGVFRWWGDILRTPEGAQGVRSLIATPEFFRVMRYRPALGRLFVPDDQNEGSRQVAVLDHDFWQTSFGGDSAIVGRTLNLSGSPVRIIGVLAQGEKPPAMGGERGADVWLPLHFDPRDNERRGWRGFYAVGRLASGVTLQVARQDMAAVRKGLVEEYPEVNGEWGLQLVSLRDRVVRRVRTTLRFFLGAAGLVLLIMLVNIANLIVARLSGRETELGIRAALGANARRLAGLLLAEGFVLALLGAGLGLLLAWVGTPFLLTLAPPGLPRLNEVGIDLTVLTFTVGLAALATLLFGLTPMARPSLFHPMQALKRETHGKPRGALGGLSGALVISEVALALALLVGAGLLTRSFVAYSRWDPGIDREHLLAVSILATTGDYHSADAVRNLYWELEGQLEALPGVRFVARTSAGPLFGGFEREQIYSGEEAREASPGRPVRWYDIGPGYFETLGIRISAGRDFTDHDDFDAPQVAIVNRSLADRLWPGESPLGKTVWLEQHEMTRVVVGVVPDIPPLDPDASVDSEIFWPQEQYGRPATFLVLRTQGDPADQQRLVAERVREVDPNLQVGAVLDYDGLVARELVQPRFNMLLIAIFSLVALVLSGVGIYGVVSRSVAARTHEIGIRIALGAQQTRLVRHVVRSSLSLAAVGVAIGLILALALSRFVRSLLHGVPPTDPATYATVVLGLFVVAALASVVPAAAASRVDPMESLRAG